MNKRLRQSGYYRRLALGKSYADRLPGLMTYEEIGRQIGATKQRAYVVTLVALGRLVEGLRERGLA